MSPDQIDQVISLISGLLTILVGAFVRHYWPPRDGRPDDPEPDHTPEPSTPPAKPKEDAPPDE
ncbi:hypothetical protein AGRA3207_000197 [Actinomadura graeca]|uniref:Uncharacterized protein n=1 Tax=Actinomadura graeca TaxID=2750812 RepID=A0ABX8QMG5_9ACTN|nr:hypothetical protein [Actinomadura graeca]QXJ19635.1 hypothetical protein AGRA3207_000197 [Actinomadura graeca]